MIKKTQLSLVFLPLKASCKSILLLIVIIAVANAYTLCQNITSPEHPLVKPNAGAHPLQDIEWWWMMGVVETSEHRTFGVGFFLSRLDPLCENLKTSKWNVGGGITDPNSNYLARGGGTFLPNDVSASVGNQRLNITSPVSSFVQWSVDSYRLQWNDTDVFTSARLSMDLVFHHISERDYGAGPAGDGFVCFDNTVVDIAYGTCSTQLEWSQMLGTGMLTIGSEKLLVSGQFFLSHQWVFTLGTETGAVAWIWLYFQLDNDWTGEISQYIVGKAAQQRQGFFNAVIPRHGQKDNNSQLEMIHFQQSQVPYFIEPTAFWTSPYTGVRYGTKHTVTVPSLQAVLYYETFIDDGDYGTFYEAPSTVYGVIGGRAVKGVGSTEYSYRNVHERVPDFS